jgi:hypothetical protein
MQLSPEQVGSVNLLLAAVQLAQKRGAFSLKEAHSLQEAINVLNPQEIDAPEGEQTETTEQAASSVAE